MSYNNDVTAVPRSVYIIPEVATEQDQMGNNKLLSITFSVLNHARELLTATSSARISELAEQHVTARTTLQYLANCLSIHQNGLLYAWITEYLSSSFSSLEFLSDFILAQRFLLLLAVELGESRRRSPQRLLVRFRHHLEAESEGTAAQWSLYQAFLMKSR